MRKSSVNGFPLPCLFTISRTFGCVVVSHVGSHWQVFGSSVCGSVFFFWTLKFTLSRITPGINYFNSQTHPMPYTIVSMGTLKIADLLYWDIHCCGGTTKNMKTFSLNLEMFSCGSRIFMDIRYIPYFWLNMSLHTNPSQFFVIDIAHYIPSSSHYAPPSSHYAPPSSHAIPIIS
jgi:hypothetical protein